MDTVQSCLPKFCVTNSEYWQVHSFVGAKIFTMFTNSRKCCPNYICKNFIKRWTVIPARLPMMNLEHIFHIYQGRFRKMASTSKYNTVIIYETENGSELSFWWSDPPWCKDIDSLEFLRIAKTCFFLESEGHACLVTIN